MGERSKIEWTDATWNPATGCTKVSDGCRNCYAEKISLKLEKWGTPKYSNGFKYTEHRKDLEIPLKWKKPKKIFVNSMSDLFHEQASMDFIDDVFDIMMIADWHVYQILTKRPNRMRDYSIQFEAKYKIPVPSHIWLGTSVEDQSTVHRIKDLQNTRCYCRFVSFEPLLGQINDVMLDGIDWCIIGGESGPDYREIKNEWVTRLINQCDDYNTNVFFKQWGGPKPKSGGREINGYTFDYIPMVKEMTSYHQEKFDKLKYDILLKRKTIKESKQIKNLNMV